MTPAAETRLHHLYDALRDAARASGRFRVDAARSNVADPLYYKRHDKGLYLLLEAEDGDWRRGGTDTDEGEVRRTGVHPETAAVVVPKTLRAVRLVPPRGAPTVLELDLRDGYRLEARDYPSARALAGELLGRLAASGPAETAARAGDAAATRRSRPRPGAPAA